MCNSKYSTSLCIRCDEFAFKVNEMLRIHLNTCKRLNCIWENGERTLNRCSNAIITIKMMRRITFVSRIVRLTQMLQSKVLINASNEIKTKCIISHNCGVMANSLALATATRTLPIESVKTILVNRKMKCECFVLNMIMEYDRPMPFAFEEKCDE